MGKRYQRVCTLILSVAILILLISCTQTESNLTPIRIGWQVSWATQGQITQVLKHTDILKSNGLKAEFRGFTYGPPLNEAALADEIDVGFVADQPAATLIARSNKFKIVARLMYFRAAIIVPSNSEIKKVSDLKGKTLAIPFGSTTHRIVLGMLKEAGLNPEKDVKIINMDISEQASVVISGTKDKWISNIDAMASWDPNIAIFEEKGLAKVLKQDLGLSIVYMSEKFIKEHRDAAVSFLKSFIMAYHYYATHQSEANEWFSKEAYLQFDPKLLDVAASFEPNLRAKNIKEIDVKLTDKHILSMQEGAKFGYDLKLTNTEPDMKAVIDNSLILEAIRELEQK